MALQLGARDLVRGLRAFREGRGVSEDAGGGPVSCRQDWTGEEAGGFGIFKSNTQN